MHVIDSFEKKKLKDIICECPRTNTMGETKMKFHTGNAPDSEGAVFQCLLIWL
jgi:hypothetical protein